MAVLGGLVLAAGIIMIPYPGPGWLVIFGGLAILATEFVWAYHLLRYARGRYDTWTRWLARRHWSIKLLVFAGTAAITLVTLWALGTFALVAGWFDVDWAWVRSPLA